MKSFFNTKIIKLFLLFLLITIKSNKIYALSPDIKIESVEASDLFANPINSNFKFDFNINGKIPKVVYEKNSDFEININKKINEYCTDIFLNAMNSKYIKTLNFNFNSKGNNLKNYQSIIIEVEVISTTKKKQLKAFSFNVLTGKELTLTDCLGPSGTRIAENVISNLISKEPDKYNISFNKINDTKNFYISNNDLFVIYSNFAFPIKMDKLLRLEISKNEYFSEKDTDYNVKLIKLLTICDNFGFNLKYNNYDKSVVITDDKDEYILYIGKNIVVKNGLPSKILESPCLIMSDARTYVPIYFFEQVLGINYYIYENGDISFTYYEK